MKNLYAAYVDMFMKEKQHRQNVRFAMHRQQNLLSRAAR